MKETAEIIIESIRAVRGKLPDQEIGNFVGVSELSTLCGGPIVRDMICRDGWKMVTINPGQWKAIIELPEGVHYGYYNIANVKHNGLYGDESARDGMGRAVYASVPPVKCKLIVHDTYATPDIESAVKEATKDGITLHLPVNGGGHSRTATAKIISMEKMEVL